MTANGLNSCSMIDLKQVIADWRKQFPDDVDLTTDEMIYSLCDAVSEATRLRMAEHADAFCEAFDDGVDIAAVLKIAMAGKSKHEVS